MNMKRFLILFAVFIIAVSNPLSAQISIGAGYLNSHSTAELNNGYGEGFYAGLSCKTPLTKVFSLIPGVYFSKIKETGGEFISSSFKDESGYFIEKALVVPLYLQWGLFFPSNIRAFLYAGPSFQYGLSCKSLSGAGTVSARDLYDEKAYGLVHQRWNVLAGGGAGFSFPIKSMLKVYLNAGWDCGLMNLYVDPSYKSRRSLWKAGVGIEF